MHQETSVEQNPHFQKSIQQQTRLRANLAVKRCKPANPLDKLRSAELYYNHSFIFTPHPLTRLSKTDIYQKHDSLEWHRPQREFSLHMMVTGYLRKGLKSLKIVKLLMPSVSAFDAGALEKSLINFLKLNIPVPSLPSWVV